MTQIELKRCYIYVKIVRYLVRYIERINSHVKLLIEVPTIKGTDVKLQDNEG